MMRNTFALLLLLIAVTAPFITVNIVAHAAPITKRGGDGKQYHGTGTFFFPAKEGGPYGACGKKENKNSRIVALNHAQYGNMDAVSSWCGKKIRVEGEAGSMDLEINDACPGCDYGDLDLTPYVFERVVGEFKQGVGPITWYLI
ncbi:hypothetical protein BDB00DRAFT_959996 [Zychaea mexicana]|uniref:uncharacterized protein n=1 Tax=Zychaea mexicana TaxID=64656 RepID=UPI0022FDD44C|nr:uncharacterized protein BDB00DRAFT_959996 [Zychaea mexicana]KAI9491098.1 hypothetical protein BDB00DRAFT_959996 [Zychaea mexicana]